MMHKVVTAIVAAIVMFALVGCQAQAPQASRAPGTAPARQPDTPPAHEPDYWPTSGWKSSTPESQGIDSGRLAAMFEAIDKKALNLHSVLIVSNGYIIAEAYFTPYDPEIKQQVMSVTKSVTGMLTGIATSQGRIKDAAQPVLAFFPGRTPANLDQNKRNLTVENLLTLTAGFDCIDHGGALNAMFRSPDWVKFALDLPINTLPGKEFRYCSPATHLLSPIVQQATGKSLRELANERLFAPLGIPPARPAEWDTDPQGNPQGFGGLRLTPRDMAKLGFLYLQGGRWNDQQVVPAEWVAASLTPHATEAASGRGYGYLIWLYGQQGYASMMGLGGQDIHIIPAKNMVVVFTAAMDIPTHDVEVVKLLDEYVVPAAASEKPLAENAASLAQLQAAIDRAASPKVAPPALPAVAAAISGKVYTMEPNPNGWQSVSLAFEEGSAEAVVTINGSGKLAIGLDNVYRVTPNGNASEAARGHWEDGDTFVVDNHMLGAAMQMQSRITFPGDEIRIELKEGVSGATGSVRGRAAR